jgi:hypothetical protein
MDYYNFAQGAIKAVATEVLDLYKAPANEWGSRLKLFCLGLAQLLVYVFIFVYDVATFCYRLGHCLGQFIHVLNDKLSAFVNKSPLPPYTTTNSWELFLPELPRITLSTNLQFLTHLKQCLTLMTSTFKTVMQTVKNTWMNYVKNMEKTWLIF